MTSPGGRDEDRILTMLILFHRHFAMLAGAGGTRYYEVARRAIAQGHTVTMVRGSYGGGSTGLGQPFDRERRHGTVDGIDVIKFDLSVLQRHVIELAGRLYQY